MDIQTFIGGGGFEDDDLFSRCVGKGIPYDTKVIDVKGGTGVSLKFNGTTSYVESKFKGDLSEHTTILITIDPDDVVCDVDEPYDRYTALSIPTFDLNKFKSSKGLKFFLRSMVWAYIDSNLIQPQKTTLLVTIDNHRKRVKFYQDGEMVGEYKFKRDFKKTTGSSLFIGSKDGETEFFKGEISQVAIFNNLLYPNEITEVSKNDVFSLTMPFGDYLLRWGTNTILRHETNKRSYRLVDL